ncbi:MAG: SpoIIE family protein phosphatase [Methylococcaceae bacterium]|nr:SpoIIE family protein phosphatase [Methylococcaceae bacterium]
MIARNQTFSFVTRMERNRIDKQDKLLRKDNSEVNYLLGGMWVRYVLALLLVAGLATSAYFIMNNLLSINEKSGTIVNVSGRQRMLSQRGALFSLRLVTAKTASEQIEAREQLSRVVDLMWQSHQGLINGNRDMGLPNKLSDAMRAMYFDAPSILDEQVKTYTQSIHDLIADSQTGAATLDNEHLQYILTVAPNRLLKTLNEAVKQYEVEAATEIQKTMRWESYVYITTLLTLLLEGLFIFKPILRRVKSTAGALIKEKQLSQNVINTSQALIVGIDVKGDIVLFNQYSQDISGWTEKAVSGKNFIKEFIPESAQSLLKKTYREMFTGVPMSKLESAMTIRSGEQLTIDWSNTLIRDPETQEPLLIIATGLDITQRKQIEQALTVALAETAALSDRLQEEVSHAGLLQKALLPEPILELPGVHGLARLTTSTEVGGDYYDYYEVDGHHAIFLVGDVSGHGVAAGTLVSAAKMSVHQLANQGETDPAAMLEHINDSLLAASHESMFMTMICFSLDSRTGQLRVANAGHVFPYLWSASEDAWSMIEAEGVPLGKVDEPNYTVMTLEMTPRDRLFIYTDGILEEESPEGEQFGFDRLEDLLYRIADAPMEVVQDVFFGSLQEHCQTDVFTDDVTIMMVEHTQRIAYTTNATPKSVLDKHELIRIDANQFLHQDAVLSDHVSRQYVVVNYHEGEIVELLPKLCIEGVRRVFPVQHEFLRELGWQNLLQQHQILVENDIYQWIANPSLQRQFVLSHSDDKSFVMQEIAGLLEEIGKLSEEMQDFAILMADELLENSLYGAPRDGRNNKLYAKGTAREISADEGIRIDLLQDEKCFGLMVTDHWGTFTPVTFLNRLLLNVAQAGIEAGVGGSGMYLMWRICDYMQIRVLPNQKTQVTLLWSLNHPSSYDTDSGFQFLYHNELNEVMGEDEVLDNFETYSESIIDDVMGEV